MVSGQSTVEVAGVAMTSITAAHHVHDLRHVLHYIAPAATLLCHFVATAISVFTFQNLKGIDRKVPCRLLLLLMGWVLASYIAEAAMLLTETYQTIQSSTDANVYAISNVLVWVILIGTLHESCRVWYPFYSSWLVCLLAEAILFVLGLTQGDSSNGLCYLYMAVHACRILALVFLPTILCIIISSWNVKDEESASLLGHDKTPNTAKSAAQSTYGAIAAASDDLEDSTSGDEDFHKKNDKRKIELQERLRTKDNWFTYARSYSIFLPFLWPSKQPLLQLHFLGVFVSLIAKAALNVLEPRQLGILLDRLSTSKTEGSIKDVVFVALTYVLYRWVLSVVGAIRHMLWIPIEQNAVIQLRLGAYNQIMKLSRDFHTDKRSGELYRSVEQGAAIIDILNSSLLRIVPVIVDLVVAVLYLSHVFGPYMALIIAGSALAYFWTSSYYLGRINVANRKCTKFSRKESQVMYDSVGGWHTVSYFNRVNYERDRYAKAVGTSSDAFRSFLSILYTSEALQDTVIDFGLAGAAFLALYQIVYRGQPIGSFAMLMSYWANFTGSLGYLVSTQRNLLRSLIEAEALLELFQRKPTVKDGSHIFQFHRGSVDFHAVKFSYDGKKDTIKSLEFHANPGQRIALVGETGGGKSTILKLLFRFYDAAEGSIRIDGQDVKDLTLKSLRECIGVVPQDPSMFNGTIMENVRYSKLDATDVEVTKACKAAAVHEKISSFTKGYASRVGEGGVKLSGGELQRIAIARVILKNPKIVLLDEATSAVDSETEAKIQGALEKLTKGRTTFTVAHRLSTVINSDIIIVIKDGEIVEQGSPKALLEAKGKYHDLWLLQIGVANAPEAKMTDPDPSHDSQLRQGGEQREEQKETQEQETRRSSGESPASATNNLRATAPAFIPRPSSAPRYQRGPAAEGGQPSHEHGASGIYNSHDSANAKTNAGKNKAAQEPNPIVDTDEASDASYLTSTSVPTENAAEKPFGGKQQISVQRRRNNKSEPDDKVMKRSQADGPNEGVRQPRRRVSAPSNALPSVLRQNEGTHQQRRRRQRDAKLRKRQAEGSSQSRLYPSSPLAPLPTPAEDASPAVGVAGKGRGSL